MIRGLTSAAGALALSIVAASCVNTLDLDGFSGATETLCETLQQCFGEDFYPDCVASTDPRLASASSSERQSWLTMFSASGCLATCAAARACLDESPICRTTRDACGQVEACCGFTTGVGECLEGNCCKPNGVPCADDGDCCLGACSVPAGATEPHCGGFACQLAGQACETHQECCTEICIAGTCSDETCRLNGSECRLNAECCDGQCEASTDNGSGEGGPSLGVCVMPACVLDGGRCDSADVCCGAYCVTSATGESVCSSDPCLPSGIECVPGQGDCCSGACNPNMARCEQLCNLPGVPCADSADCCDGNCEPATMACGCYPEGSSCMEHTDCCAGACNGGFCGDVMCPAVGTACDPNNSNCCDVAGTAGCQEDPRRANGGAFACCDAAMCDHTVCVLGGPLLPACVCVECDAAATDPPATPEQCIAAICGSLPHCCCFDWDAECVAAAKTTCFAVCGNGMVGGL